MRILMYEPAGKGGLSPYTVSLSEALVKNNVNVTLLTSKNFVQINEFINIISCLKPMKNNWVLRLKLFWAVDRLYRSIFNAYMRNSLSFKAKPDIVHLQVTVPLVDQFFLPRLSRKVKTVLTVHDVVWHDPKNLNNRIKLLDKIYNSVHHLIVHTHEGRSRLIGEFHVNADRVTVIPHGIDTEKVHIDTVNLAAIRKKLGIRHDGPVILFFGNIRDNKGLDLLLNSIHLLNEENVRTTLVVAGRMPTGATFERYDKIIDELKLRSNVVCHIRWINDEETHAFFEVADIVVLPYISFASQSGVLLQAYKYNKPVVVTNVGGMEEIVAADHTGIVVEPDSRHIADGIKKLLDDKEFFNSAARNMAKSVNDKYCWDIVATDTLDVYKKIVSGTGNKV